MFKAHLIYFDFDFGQLGPQALRMRHDRLSRLDLLAEHCVAMVCCIEAFGARHHLLVARAGLVIANQIVQGRGLAEDCSGGRFALIFVCLERLIKLVIRLVEALTQLLLGGGFARKVLFGPFRGYSDHLIVLVDAFHEEFVVGAGLELADARSQEMHLLIRWNRNLWGDTYTTLRRWVERVSTGAQEEGKREMDVCVPS